MGITISHESALQVIRQLRCGGNDVSEMDRIGLRVPATQVGKRWTRKEFDSETWLPEPPSRARKLHVLVPTRVGSVRMSEVVAHLCRKQLPPKSVVYLTPSVSCVCPELLFYQLAATLGLAEAVMLGYELCGSFSIPPDNLRDDDAATMIPAATCVEDIDRYLGNMESAHGIVKARRALGYVCDGAISVPEAVIATMYSLPPEDGGYGLGPVALNKRISVESDYEGGREEARFPDLLLPFAPVGVNYDGERDHLDLGGLVDAVREAECATGNTADEARAALARKLASVRAKYVDDNLRNRQLAARGFIVMPATKEDLYGRYNLDAFTRCVLMCAKNVFGANVDEALDRLDDTELTRQRYEALSSLLFPGQRIRA